MLLIDVFCVGFTQSCFVGNGKQRQKGATTCPLDGRTCCCACVASRRKGVFSARTVASLWRSAPSLWAGPAPVNLPCHGELDALRVATGPWSRFMCGCGRHGHTSAQPQAESAQHAFRDKHTLGFVGAFVNCRSFRITVKA